MVLQFLWETNAYNYCDENGVLFFHNRSLNRSRHDPVTDDFWMTFKGYISYWKHPDPDRQ